MMDWLYDLGTRFTAEDYIVWSRIQGTAWTSADLVIVYNLIRIADLGRDYMGIPLHRWSLWILYATIPPCLLIPLSYNHLMFLRLELMVTIPHFLLIVYVILANFRIGPKALWKSLEQRSRPTTPSAPSA
jgi:hypothetical protein